MAEALLNHKSGGRFKACSGEVSRQKHFMRKR
ncbi:MAG TPA: hypothetical protein VGI45_04920 [Terracidiphilus sp.]